MKIAKCIIALILFSFFYTIHAIDWTITNASDVLIGVMIRDNTPNQPLRLLRLQPGQSGFLPKDKIPATLHIYLIEKEGTLSPTYKMRLSGKYTEFSVVPKVTKNPKGTWKIRVKRNENKPAVTKNLDPFK